MIATLGVATRAAGRRAIALADLLRKERIVALRYDGSLGGGSVGAPFSLLYVGRETWTREVEVYFKPAGDGGVAASARAAARTNPPAVVFRGSIFDYARHRGRIEREAGGVDMVVHEAFPGALAREDDLFHYPILTATLPVARSLEQQIHRVRSQAQRRLMRDLLRRGDYVARFAEDRGSLEAFRATMHEPYVRERFGAWGNVDSPERLREIHGRSGGVLFVAPRAEPDRPVCGALLLGEGGRVLDYNRNGFLDAGSWSATLMAERTAALELAMMKHAIDRRFDVVDFGYARAVLNDGLLTHKRRLGCSFAPASYSPLLRLRVRPGRRAEAFACCPLVVGARGEHTAVLGYDDGRATLTKRAWRGALKGFALPLGNGASGALPQPMRGAVVWTKSGAPTLREAAFREAVKETLMLPDGVEFRLDAPER